jgi:pimeloyl-ACP methyl ester carboxylesterase
MPLLIFSTLLFLFSTVLGLLCWSILYLFKFRNHGRKVLKASLFGFLCSYPVFLFLVVPVTFSHLVVNASTRPQDRQLKTTPADYGCSFSEARFHSRDALTLRGWFIEGSSQKIPIIFSHGLFRNRHEVLKRACELSHEGHSVLLFDLRNHGASQRRAISLGYQERLDVLGAKDFVIDHLGVDEVVVAGVSMGAVASIFATKESVESVAAVVADSPFDTLVETVARHTEHYLKIPSRPFSDVFIWNLTREADFSADQLNTVAAVSRVTVPVLLIYGENDLRMTEEVAKELHNAVSSSQKQLVFFEGAGHGDAYETDPEAYVNCIVDFLADSGH